MLYECIEDGRIPDGGGWNEKMEREREKNL